MGEGSRRNRLCWCGSGRKYKYCHLHRETEQPASKEEVKELSVRARNKRECLHPDANLNLCKGGIIRAHTVQQTRGLKAIARKGHVYTLQPEITSVIRENFQIKPRKVGIKDASTFNGFCSYHDSNTFAPIEQKPFTISQYHCFLLAYRAICHELYAKNAQNNIAHYSTTLDRGRNKQEQVGLQYFLKLMQEGISKSLKDLEYYKTLYDNALKDSNFSEVNYYVICFEQTPEIMFSGAFYPESDFTGRELQNLYKLDRRAEHATFHLINSSSGGKAVLTWLGESNSAINLAKSLHLVNDAHIPHALLRLAFAHIDNLYFSPDWWDDLTPRDREGLTQRMISGADPNIQRQVDYLRFDGMKVVQWSLSARETNLDL